MRRPNLKWLLKSLCLLLVSGTLFLLITTWISASPYTNKISHLQHAHKQEAENSQNVETVPMQRQAPPVAAQQVDNGRQQQKQQQLPETQEEEKDKQQRQESQEEEVVEEEEKEQQQLQESQEIKQENQQLQEQHKQQKQQEQQEQQQQLQAPDEIKKDWHDYTAMERDAKRVGIGEHGIRAEINDNSLRDQEQTMSLQNGFNALLSDSISVNRSVPDIRHKDCQKKQYLVNLPTVSIIIPYYNEHFSVLVRSVHSLVNRSPPELLREIILVDDFSDREYLFAQLDQYVAENFPKVQIIRLEKRTGLIGARMAGARKATSKVLIFLDSHIEANYNWLPPLLEPIALNKRTSVCPFIDVIDHDNFEYRAQDEGARGAFDWEFYYKRLPLLPEDLVDRTKPFKSPIMAGGLFAISSVFFWDLGGYDEGLDIWGGEQYELSFKIWMCGGDLLDAPCSRVAHIYRGPRNNQQSPRKGDYLHRNYKRVAEVWMDEYKHYLYQHSDGLYENIDAGDLTAQKEIRTKLQCKSFKWFMENVAFDLTKVYPPVEPPDYAYGAIQNIGDPTLCVDTLSKPRHSEVGLYACAENLQRPQRNQNWALSWHRDLRLRHKMDCLDVQQSNENAPVWLWDCHGQGGNQFWYYDVTHEWLMHGRNGLKGRRCLEAQPIQRKLVVNDCNEDNLHMKWKFGFVNKTALESYFKDLPHTK